MKDDHLDAIRERVASGEALPEASFRGIVMWKYVPRAYESVLIASHELLRQQLDAARAENGRLKAERDEALSTDLAKAGRGINIWQAELSAALSRAEKAEAAVREYATESERLRAAGEVVIEAWTAGWQIDASMKRLRAALAEEEPDDA